MAQTPKMPRLDRTGKRSKFQHAQAQEREYAKLLQQVAKQVGVIVKAFTKNGTPYNTGEMQRLLGEYAKLLLPWARSVAEVMVRDVARRNERQWRQNSKDMGKAMRREVTEAPTGQALRDFLEENVVLITSLPTEAAQRVHKLTTEALSSGRRAEEIAKDILETGNVTASRARLIARTEVARTAAGLTMARAEYVGSEGYIWRTSGDSDVRESHKEMEGKYVRWDTNGGKGPHLSDGTTTHAGMIYNCRCFAEVIFPEFDN